MYKLMIFEMYHICNMLRSIMRYMRYLLSEISLTLCCYYAVNDEFIEVDLDNSWGVVMEMEMAFG